MRFIKGKYGKILMKHESIRDYSYNEHDYFLQQEKDFTVSLNQVVFNKDFLGEDIRDLSKNDYLIIKEIAVFCVSDAKNLSCKDMKKYIMKKYTKELYESI